MKIVQVLGTDCPRCHHFYEIVSEVAESINKDIKVEYINDIQKIIDIGLMQSPALVIDDEALITGFSSDRELIRELITNHISG
jgi:small redox-active disulfide protein 2